MIFGSTDPKCFAHLDQTADTNGSDGPVPKSSEVREILELSPHWTKWPDYERVCYGAATTIFGILCAFLFDRLLGLTA